MTDQYTKMTSRHPHRTEFHDFGCVDQKGRKIGANIYKSFQTFEIEPGATGGYCVEPGTYWVFCPHATRNGELYGPIQNDYRFKTEEEQAAAIAKYLKSAKSRAMKKSASK